MVRSGGVAKVLLAFDDVGMAVQLQEELEGVGHEVRWDGAQQRGPAAGPTWADVVLITVAAGDQELAERVRAWHDADPPPALLIIGPSAEDREAAARLRVPFVASTSPTPAIDDAIAQAIKLRFASSLQASSPLKVGLRALGLSTDGESLDASARLIAGARKADVEMVREALRWHAADYVSVSADWIARLREIRALTIPEVEFAPILDGTHCLQTVLRGGRLEPWQAARFVWALASIGALIFTPEPPDESTTRRRRLTQTRDHLRARQKRLARATYYDVLEVTQAATPAHVAQAVQALALRYSPERLGHLDLATLTPLVEPTWKQIREAHKALGDMGLRTRYNAWWPQQKSLSTEWGRGDIDAAGAAQAMARGQSALVAGQLFKAVSDMAAACRLHPQHPDYEASLAWARFRADTSRSPDDKPAIAKRERAVAEAALAGHRPWPRALLALGLLCVADGDAEAARWHLHEALTVDPNLPAARQLLQRIGNPRAPTEV